MAGHRAERKAGVLALVACLVAGGHVVTIALAQEIPIACADLSKELKDLKAELATAQADLQKTAGGAQKAPIAQQINQLNTKIAAKQKALDACIAQNPEVKFDKVKTTVKTFPIHGPFIRAQAPPAGPGNLRREPDPESSEESDNEPPRSLLSAVRQPGASARAERPVLGETDGITLVGGTRPTLRDFKPDSAGLEARDLQIAASHSHVIISSSHYVSLWDRSGTRLLTEKTRDLFSLVKDDMNATVKDPVDPNSTVSSTFPINEFYDTRLVFDTYRNRFWLASLVRNMGPRPAKITPAQVEQWKHRVTLSAVAVSKTENPNDGWFTYWWEPATDYQAIGVSQKLLVIGHLLDSTHSQFGSMTVARADLLATGALPPATVSTLGGLTNSDGSAMGGDYLQPALHHGPSKSGMHFLINTWGEGKSVLVWGVDPNDLSQVFRAAVPVMSYAFPAPVVQASNADIPHPQQIVPVYDKSFIMKAVCRGDRLYAVWGDAKPNRNTAQRYLRLVRMDVSHAPAYLPYGSASGRIDDRFGTNNAADPPGSVFSYYMPTLAVNQDGTMLVSYCRTGPGLFPEARYTVYYAKEAGQRPSELVQKGEYPVGMEDPNFNVSGQQPSQTGTFDYNGISVDPTDDRSFWIINVYGAEASQGQGRYKLVAKQLVFGSPP